MDHDLVNDRDDVWYIRGEDGNYTIQEECRDVDVFFDGPKLIIDDPQFRIKDNSKIVPVVVGSDIWKLGILESTESTINLLGVVETQSTDDREVLIEPRGATREIEFKDSECFGLLGDLVEL